jgi:hypothetical protein
MCFRLLIYRQLTAGAVLFLFLILTAVGFAQAAQTDGGSGQYVITGQLIDSQEQPIVDAEILLQPAQETDESAEPLAQTQSLEDGSFALRLENLPPESAVLTIESHHFKTRHRTLAG